MARSSASAGKPIPVIEVTGPAVPPAWATMQRYLFETMARAADAFVRRYTRPDGTLVWRDEWPGMDGSDDAYESFGSFPLFYALGGDARVHEWARREWEAVTRQFTGYGQVYNEFDAYYDWMHHGESSLYLYNLGLADPYVRADRERALRFAGMYMGEDPEARNWDAGNRLIRSPITGSRGPRFEMSAEDWVTHRPILANYLTPYEDVPGIDASRDPMVKADWNDDGTFAEILKLMNARMGRGDVPLNLTSTSLITSAFLYTGEAKYRDWVVDYLSAWCDRAKRNGGIMPDNVGLSGRIGECMAGKWWGGYYGWRWPHGAMNILESTLVAGSNAALLTGDLSHLDLVRSQLDLLWSLGREEEGVFKLPKRHGDVGWFDYAPPDARLWIHLFHVSQQQRDLDRLLRLSKPDLPSGGWRFGKGGQVSPQGWLAYMQGSNPAYPEQALGQTCEEMNRRLEIMRGDTGDPGEWDVHHWQNINPVVCEPLFQLTMGAPGVVYHGGLCHARVRHFDPERRRPGLPEHVSALVEGITPEHIVLQLVNTDALAEHEVWVQAGAYREHRFTHAEVLDPESAQRGGQPLNCAYVRVCLGPAAQVRLRLRMDRYVAAPTYDWPWAPG